MNIYPTRSSCKKGLSRTLLALGMASSGTVFAQTGAVAFHTTESALAGTVSCNGGPATPIASVDTSTADTSGSNEVIGSSLSANACGLPLYNIASADDSSAASDTTASDYASGSSVMTRTCLLGGVLCFDSKNEADKCTSDLSGNVSCVETSNGSGLYFGGRQINGTFTTATTFQATNLQLSLGSACAGLALFNGTLKLASSTQSVVSDVNHVFLAPVALKGTLTCLGLPLSTMTVDLQDATKIEYGLITANISLAVIETANTWSPPPH